MVDDMIKEWYCMLADRIEGPFSLQELGRMSESGALGRDAMVRKGEAGTWMPIRTAMDSMEEATKTAAPPPIQSPKSTADVARVPEPMEPKLALDGPFSEWGVASMALGSVFLLATPLTVHTMIHLRDHAGSRFLTFLLVFMLELLLLVGSGVSVGFSVMGIIAYVKKQQRLPLNLAGAVVSVLSLFLWLVNAIVVIRTMD